MTPVGRKVFVSGLAYRRCTVWQCVCLLCAFAGFGSVSLHPLSVSTCLHSVCSLPVTPLFGIRTQLEAQNDWYCSAHLVLAPRGPFLPPIDLHHVSIRLNTFVEFSTNQFHVRSYVPSLALSATVDAWKDLTAGIVGGFALVAAGHPLDTVRFLLFFPFHSIPFQCLHLS